MQRPEDAGSPLVAARLDRLPMTALHKRFVAIMALGNFFEIYELFLAGVLATTLKATFSLVGFDLSLVLASTFVGAFFGAVVIGRLADRIGRRGAYMLTLTTYSAATLVCAFAPNLWSLILFRFIAGIGLGGELPVTDSFLGDILPPQQRGRYAAWAFTAAYLAVPAVGFLGMKLIGESPLGIAGWRWMFAVGSLGALLTFLVRRGLPESPRWLESVGRRAEADAVATRFEEAAEAEGWTRPPVTDVTPQQRPVRLPARSIFRAPLARRTALMAVLWILAPIGYYGFGSLGTLVLAAKGLTVSSSLTYLTFSFIGYPLGSFLSVLVMERAERKWILCASLVGMGLFGLAYGNAASPMAIILAGFCFTLVANVMSNSGHIYQLEQFPTSVRTTATGWLYSLSRLSTAAAPFYLIPLLDAHGAGTTFAVVAAAMLLSALAVAFGVRTTGLSVESISGAPQDADFPPSSTGVPAHVASGRRTETP
ncbi:MFS transporter [Streptomyces pluripotens]|uniref:MFS transporter n=1 Tax=Streptomyces pluripotens TaxID=1355015 RepID=A0A221P6H3_9ACTN|nr:MULTISPECIES: MFS transporter [Streptomyces]ARP73556.1 MFS transporter [Streptomyces pluripotens]ASN27807.1 MFS transporter [Streptomyces pluripotens]KIE26793.1 MFS transporter [Streptomyces sp. MUSC 125]MCH0557259.1 MFS transporter [Streptomyces sp. MUM 16J]